jgi:hypothetical protein
MWRKPIKSPHSETEPRSKLIMRSVGEQVSQLWECLLELHIAREKHCSEFIFDLIMRQSVFT